MKTISLVPGDKEILKAICENSEEGYSISDIRTALKTLDAIEDATDTLVLDDAYQVFLVQKFEKAKFIKPSSNILSLYDKIK